MFQHVYVGWFSLTSQPIAPESLFSSHYPIAHISSIFLPRSLRAGSTLSYPIKSSPLHHPGRPPSPLSLHSLYHTCNWTLTVNLIITQDRFRTFFLHRASSLLWTANKRSKVLIPGILFELRSSPLYESKPVIVQNSVQSNCPLFISSSNYIYSRVEHWSKRVCFEPSTEPYKFCFRKQMGHYNSMLQCKITEKNCFVHPIISKEGRI